MEIENIFSEFQRLFRFSEEPRARRSFGASRKGKKNSDGATMTAKGERRQRRSAELRLFYVTLYSPDFLYSSGG